MITLNTNSRRLFESRLQKYLKAFGLNILSPLFSINYVEIEKYTNFEIKENNQKLKISFLKSKNLVKKFPDPLH